MLLRAATTFLMLFGLVLSLGYPWIIGPKPALHAQQGPFAIRLGVYMILIICSFLGAAVCAILMMRRAREAYREETRQNLEDLIETTLRTHQHRPESHE
ncbi:MAG: hypothetical protein QOJ65_68 [Fimbriimonadaceae bacterium]|jgi:hypothetical protein|nr:hypothetical protein [Fimbriimonadaceae bacterium]